MKYFFYHTIITVRPVTSGLVIPGKRKAPMPDAILEATYTNVCWTNGDVLTHDLIRSTIKVPDNTILINHTLIDFKELSAEQAEALKPGITKHAGN